MDNDDQSIENPYRSPAEVPDDAGPRDQPIDPNQAGGTASQNPITLVVVAGVGITLGGISRFVRPFMNFGGVHYESLASLATLCIICLVLVILQRGQRRRRGQFFYQGQAFLLWTGFVAGWLLVHRTWWWDVVRVNVVFWFGCAVFGGCILVWLQRRRAAFAGNR